MTSQINKRLALVAMLFSLVFVVTNATAKKPDKEDKPDKTTAECIVFTGDLMGEAEVEGCCPNAGPFPDYAMTLDLEYKDENGAPAYYVGGPYEGKLFINNYGAGRSHGYWVQFWNEDLCFEAIGGVIDNDRKNKVLTVSFNGEEAYFCETETDENGDIIFEIFPLVSFVLVRTSDCE